MTATYQSGLDALADWRDNLLSGKPPELWPAGNGALGALEIGPGIVVLIGAPPGAGKTALTVQLVVDALRLTPSLRALIANVEMSVGALLDRQLARLSGIDLALIRHRKTGAEHAERLDRGLAALDAVADRLVFLKPPFKLRNLAAAADDFGARLILIDYVQRFNLADGRGDRRAAVDATMTTLRQFAECGTGIIVVSSVGRQKDARGRSSYEGLNLASYKESGELEFGADSAYLIAPDPDGAENAVILHNPKNRHGEPRDIHLTFNGKCQRFDAAPESSRPDARRLKSALADLWAHTPAAADDDEGDD